MNSPKNTEQRELLHENIDGIIDLLNTLRSEIRNCEEDYYMKREGNQEFTIDYWYDRFLMPANLCVDVVTFSNGLLKEIFNPGEGYDRSFAGTEHIFTVKPTSNELFIQNIVYLRALLIPLALLYLHAAKNPENQSGSQKLVGNIMDMVGWIIKLRGEDIAAKTWEAIDKGRKYFSS